MSKILIVEDDQQVANELAQNLTAAGHRCAVQTAGEGVVELIRRNEPDLLVLDMMLPGISGFQICRQIRNDDALYRLPILVVSAMNGKEEVHHGLAQGADDYITKPFKISDFLQRTDALLKASESAGYVDEVTSLADAQGFRKDLQRRLASSSQFALAYIEMVGAPQFLRVGGQEASDKALRHLARALNQCGSALKDGQFFAGHLGGGHFMCVLPPRRARSFCERIEEVWQNHRKGLIDSLPAVSRKQLPILDLMFCITVREEGESLTPTELLDIVSRIRQLRTKDNRPGIHLDRRATGTMPDWAPSGR